MAKKSFKNSARDSVASAFFGSIEKPKIDPKEEKAEHTMNTQDTPSVSTVQNTPNTQDTKDTIRSTPDYRINLKLKGEFKKYLSDVAWENRTSITNYLNDLIEKDMKEKSE